MRGHPRPGDKGHGAGTGHLVVLLSLPPAQSSPLAHTVCTFGCFASPGGRKPQAGSCPCLGTDISAPTAPTRCLLRHPQKIQGEPGLTAQCARALQVPELSLHPTTAGSPSNPSLGPYLAQVEQPRHPAAGALQHAAGPLAHGGGRSGAEALRRAQWGRDALAQQRRRPAPLWARARRPLPVGSVGRKSGGGERRSPRCGISSWGHF